MASFTFKGITFSDSDVVQRSESYTPPNVYNPGIRPFLLHDHGFVLAVVIARSTQDAVDDAVDEGKLDRFQLDPNDKSHQANYMEPVTNPGKENPGFLIDGTFYDWKDGVSFLGSAGEPFDIEGLEVVELPNPKFSLCALLQAHEEGS